MAYKKDQGRYARMTAFWALFLLAADGCLRGLQGSLRTWFPGLGEDWMEPLPLIGQVDGAKLIVLLTLAAVGFAIHRTLERPKLADLLIDTEHELKSVTWPSFAETWTGSLAVIVTVFTMLFYLFASDVVLSAVLPRLMGSSG
jgi:preprotein translocase SecE subunit